MRDQILHEDIGDISADALRDLLALEYVERPMHAWELIDSERYQQSIDREEYLDVWWAFDDIYCGYIGGPIAMSDDIPDTTLIPVRHNMAEDGVCRKCKRTAEQIAQAPTEECLLQVDFSAITRGLAGS